MKNHTLSQQDFDSNNGDLSSGNDFIKSHALSQCDYSSNFKQMYGDVEKWDVSSGYGSMNSHTFYQLNGFKSFMNFNYMDDMEASSNLQNVDVSSGIGLINRHTLPQCN